jgi:integrase/recombinase XerD
VARKLEQDSLASGGKQLSDATRQFLEDKQQQNSSTNWVYKHRREVNQLVSFFGRSSPKVSEIALDDLEAYRKTWTGSPTSRRKRQERLRQFFRYCQKHDWCAKNPAADLSPIKVDPVETLPLTREQFATALTAVKEYHPRGRDGDWRRQRAIAMLQLCRHSGLRISDAARLERVKLRTDNSLLLRTSKTGQGVYVPQPPQVAELLRQLENDNPRYFFWNGTSAKETPGKLWWTTLKTIFNAAGIPDSHPHCLRDTFAVECLLGGIDIKDVSVMLGHSSVAITEKHYLPWVRARQVRLEDSMQKMWAQ